VTIQGARVVKKKRAGKLVREYVKKRAGTMVKECKIVTIWGRGQINSNIA